MTKNSKLQENNQSVLNIIVAYLSQARPNTK